MKPLQLSELREQAIKNNSVNVHLASAWELRWHDPFWIAAWERWRKAQAAWEIAWKNIPFKEYGDIYNPNAESISNEIYRAVATEYVDARFNYKQACEFYHGLK